MQYNKFMIKFMKALEPRFFEPGEYIFEEGEEVDKQIYIVWKDERKPIN